MDTDVSAKQTWDGADIPALVSLEQIGALRYRSRWGDSNLNGRAYGGQALGQATMAASMSVPADRNASTMHLLFLQGTDPEQPVDFEVTVLQEGKRFSSRHVRGTQPGGRTVLDAHATFALPLSAPRHAAASSARTRPEDLPELSCLPSAFMKRLRPLTTYAESVKDCLDFRLADIESLLLPEARPPRFQYWLRARGSLPASPHLHAAVFAYISDWWLNFSSLVSHVHELRPEDRLYISSLNHSIWFHRPFAPNRWMHFDSESPCAEGGRGLSVVRVHDEEGQMLATITQECLAIHADA